MTHPLPQATTRLHELLTEALGETVSVDFGFRPGETESLDALVVGLSTEDVAATTGVVEYEMAGEHHNVEINCMAQSVNGDNDPGVALARCFELLDQVRSALAHDRQLDGSVAWGRVTNYRSQWTRTDAGDGALLIFPVTVEAFRDHEEP